MKLALAVAAGCLLLVPAAGAAPSAAKTIGTRGYVVEISADGGRVAIHAAEDDFTRDACEHASVWTPATNTIARLPEDKCGSQSDFVYEGLGLAGARVAWAEYDSGNHSYCYGPYTVVVGKKTPVDLGRCGGAEGETGEGWRFIGDGSLLVGEYVQSCDPCLDENGELDESAEEPVALYRVTSALHPLTRPRGDVELLDVAGGRILAREGSSLVVYSAAGKRGLAIAAGATAGGFSGGDIVGVKGNVLTLYDAAKGSIKARRTLRGNKPQFRGTDSGLAVYVASTVFETLVHVIRLSDGRDRVLLKLKNLVDIELEPSGLFYAWNAGKGEKPGRVTFVPIADVQKSLR